MYIRKSSRSYKGRTYTNYLLVESVHTPKGPRQRTVCSLGDLSPRPREEWLKLARKIEDALIGQSDLLDADVDEVADIVRRVRARRARHPAHVIDGVVWGSTTFSVTANCQKRRANSHA
jgi:hypothetical protein